MPAFSNPEAEHRFRAAYDAVLSRWPRDRQQRRLSTGFGITVVQVCGVESGLPVLLLHGGGSTAASWFANVGALAGSCRIYAPDRPGEAGLSESGPTELQERDDWMSWIGAVLDRLGVTRCAVVGHSFGGWLALSYAVHAPHRVSHLALLDPTSCFRGGRTGYNLRAIPLFLRPTASRLRSFLHWETGGRSVDPTYLGLLAEATEGVRTARTVLPRRPTEQALHELDVPTLLVLPADSRQNDPVKTAADARERMADVTVVELSGHTHHTIPTESAEELNRILLDFLL